MEIKFGKKYTCSPWKSGDKVDYYTIIVKIEEGEICSNTFDSDNNFLMEQKWFECGFFSGGSNSFYCLDKYVKNTALARRMYPEGEIEGEWLVIYG